MNEVFDMAATVGSMTEHQIASASLEDDRILLRWSDRFEQRLQSAYLRHSPGFPGSSRPAGFEGRFTKSADGFAPRQASVTSDGNLQLIWQPGDVKSLHESDWLRDQSNTAFRHQLSPQQVH